MSAILTKTTSTGQQIEVRLSMKGYAAGCDVYLDGKRIIEHGRSAKLKTPKGAITHYIGQASAVGLTTTEFETLAAPLATAERAAAKKARRFDDSSRVWRGSRSMEKDDSIF